MRNIRGSNKYRVKIQLSWIFGAVAPTKRTKIYMAGEYNSHKKICTCFLKKLTFYRRKITFFH